MDEKNKEQKPQTEDKAQVKKALVIYLMVFLGCVTVLIGLAYIFQLKDNRETELLLQGQMVTIEANETLIQNKQLENEKLKKDIENLKAELATAEASCETLEASSEVMEKEILNTEKLLEVYKLYSQGKWSSARKALKEVSAEYVDEECYKIIDDKLN
ncbi:MAG: hypothetical protein IKZ25_04420 [Clostridia bacterium]|nr:hypothetical protein [Clostridia bacterium]